MSNTPETDMKQRLMYMDALECVEIDFARKLERERNRYKSDVEVITKERDEAIRALTNIAALPTMAVDHNVVRARKIAQEALRNLEAAK